MTIIVSNSSSSSSNSNSSSNIIIIIQNWNYSMTEFSSFLLNHYKEIIKVRKIIVKLLLQS